MHSCTNLPYQTKQFSFQDFELQYLFHYQESTEKYRPLLIVADGSEHGVLKDLPQEIADQKPMILFLPFTKTYLKQHGLDSDSYTFRKEPVKPVAALLKLIDSVLQEYPIDFERIYLCGSASGGIVCWELMRRRIGLFAAALMIGTKTDLTDWNPNAATAIRLYHGVDDTEYPIDCSRRLYLSLMDVYCDVKLHEFPGTGAEALHYLFHDPKLFQWLFSVRQKVFTSMPIPENMSVVELDAFGFTAKILPEAGGNIFSLQHKATGTQLLREPHRKEELFHTPERFGIPPLFPPNRIEDGAFLFEGKICHLPINQKVQNLHLHGIAISKPWLLVKQAKHFAELKFVFNETSPEYEGFPFTCEIIRRYELTEQGLKDTAIIRNTGTCNMPLGFGYHTAFPAEGATVRVGAADHKFEINKTSFLPTGRCLEWSEFHPGTPFIPFGTVVDFHCRTGVLKQDDGTEFQGAELVYPQGTLRYITDEKFGFWYTWNAGGLNDFICLEPVSWMSNALNLPLPASRSGVRKLAAGEEISFVNLLEFTADH
ncbi:MAG: hypothetical protein E7040_08520 [Lentisphaerae bacterium]|nr:hypothetical protein [Lentisphaerota bacterium]